MGPPRLVPLGRHIYPFSFLWFILLSHPSMLLLFSPTTYSVLSLPALCFTPSSSAYYSLALFTMSLGWAHAVSLPTYPHSLSLVLSCCPPSPPRLPFFYLLLSSSFFFFLFRSSSFFFYVVLSSSFFFFLLLFLLPSSSSLVLLISSSSFFFLLFGALDVSYRDYIVPICCSLPVFL